MDKDREAAIVNPDSNEANDIHLMLTYTGAQCPTDPTKPATFSIDVQCDPSIQDSDAVFTVASNDPCAAVVQTKTASGCQVFSFNALWAFVTKYYYVWGGLAILVGLILTFAGRKIFKPAICMAGTLAAAGLITFFSYEVILSAHPPEWAGWTTLAVAVVIGILVGVILAKIAKVGVALLAAWGGVSLGFICYSAFLYKLHSTVAFWAVVVAFGLIFAGLTFCIFDPILITATSLAGSYAIVRGTSAYAGGYPNEFTLYEYIEHDQFNSIPTTFYYYLAAFFLVMLLGMIVQCRSYKKDKEEDNHPYKRYRN